MKKILRLFFKIIGTPFFLFFSLGVLLVGRILMFFNWLYDKEYSLRMEKEMEAKEIQRIKKWFTTL